MACHTLAEVHQFHHLEWTVITFDFSFSPTACILVFNCKKLVLAVLIHSIMVFGL